MGSTQTFLRDYHIEKLFYSVDGKELILIITLLTDGSGIQPSCYQVETM